jgi:hypothetical protein
MFDILKLPLASLSVVFLTLESVDFKSVTIAPEISPPPLTAPVMDDC